MFINFLTQLNEKKRFVTVFYLQHPKYWMSLVWAGAVVTRAKKEGRIKDDFAFRTIIKEINQFRSGCGGKSSIHWEVFVLTILP